MATVEKRAGKNGRVSYRITVSCGIDSAGKQTRYRRMWSPPKEGMSDRQIEKALTRAVTDFEREIEQGYRIDGRQTFSKYAEYVLALKAHTGVKRRTIERYESLLFRVNQAIGHMKLSEIRPQHLNAFYQNLGEKGIKHDNGKAVPICAIGDILKERGISIASFARKCGVSASTVATAVRGGAILPSKAELISKSLSLPLCDCFMIEKKAESLSSKTILEHHRVISAIMAQAEKEMLIPFNPASKATPPKIERRTPDYYQPEDIKAILKALDNAPLKWRTMTYLLIDTGCRRGEAVGLKWESVNLNDGIICIDRALLYSPKHGVYEETTKTGDVRVLGIASETVSLLRELKAVQDDMRDAYGDAWIETGYVFTRDNGDCINPDSLTDWLTKFSKENGLLHIHLHPHAFRHTAASMMIANSVDIVTVANELGHASPTTTANIYAHQIAEAKARAKNVRAGIFKLKE